jgi:predicted nucleic acid-binding protein
VLYILDTDMVIFMLRGLKAPARQRARRERALALVARCREAQTKGDIVGLSAVTVSELEFGAHNSGNHDTEIYDFHRVRMALAPEIPCFSAFPSFTDRKK